MTLFDLALLVTVAGMGAYLFLPRRRRGRP